MANAENNAFEIERRLILLKYNTNMPDDTILGYDGDPNDAVNGNTDGETLIYNVSLGAHFMQSDGTMWRKVSTPNTWVKVGATESAITGKVVSKTVAVGTTENFYSLDLNKNDSFDFTLNALSNGLKHRAKMDALYDGNSILWNTYSFLGEDLDLAISIYVDSGYCNFDITNNGSYDADCEVQLKTFYET